MSRLAVLLLVAFLLVAAFPTGALAVISTEGVGGDIVDLFPFFHRRRRLRPRLTLPPPLPCLRPDTLLR